MTTRTTTSPRRPATRLASAAAVPLAVALLAAAAGCDRTSSTYGTIPNSGTGMTGMGDGAATSGPRGIGTGGVSSGQDHAAGGAPTFGEAEGNGFHSGDAIHGTGMGSGLMGWHGTGKLGTSEAISDAHDAGKPPKNAPQWVLPEQ